MPPDRDATWQIGIVVSMAGRVPNRLHIRGEEHFSVYGLGDGLKQLNCVVDGVEIAPPGCSCGGAVCDIGEVPTMALHAGGENMGDVDAASERVAIAVRLVAEPHA